MAQLIVYPDAVPTTTTTDCGMLGTNAVWATCRALATASFAPNNAATSFFTEAYTGFGISRSIVLFNPLLIPKGSTIISATLDLYKNATAVSNGDSSAICMVASTPASNTAVADVDFDQLGTTRLATDVNYSSISTSAYFTMTLNATGLAAIDTAIAGQTMLKLGLRDKRDLDNSAPTGINSIAMNSSDAGSNKPRLTINYNAPGFWVMF